MSNLVYSESDDVAIINLLLSTKVLLFYVISIIYSLDLSNQFSQKNYI
jgi:hypothetical protein